MTKPRLALVFFLVGIFTVFVLATPRFVFAEHEAESKEPAVVNDSPSHADDANTQASAPSLWGGFLSAIGLNNDMPAPPPQELKGSQEHFGQDYVIGAGDQLGITVWRDDMLTKAVLVLPDGKIQFPLIGELVVGGKTVGEVKKELVEKLASYVVDADISVEVKQSSSLFIYIIGKVNAPGRQMLVSETTVLQALAMAGGVNTFASEDNIKIFRQQKDSTLVYKFRYSYVSAGKHLEDNILLKRGDVIVVP
jgi:polysaccharide export outer membrane protein